jgi:hypothetical protein
MRNFLLLVFFFFFSFSWITTVCVCLQHSSDKCRCMKPIYSCRSFTWFNSRIRHPLYTLFSWFLLRSSKLNRDNTPHPSWIGNVLLEGNYNDIWQESNLIKMSSYIFFPFSFTIERTVVSIHLKSHLNSIWDYFLFSGRREGRHGRKGGKYVVNLLIRQLQVDV